MKKTRGFVYLWRDRKHNRYYLGCHWGEPRDTYVCSSRRMLNAYKRRPEDFKRRILGWAFSKEELLELEYRWLSQIDENELSNKYYNVFNHHFSHWSSGDFTKEIAEKGKIKRSESLKRHHEQMTLEEKEAWIESIREATLQRKRDAMEILRPLFPKIKADLESGMLFNDVAEKYDTNLGYLRDLALENGFESVSEIKPVRHVVHSEETRQKIREGHLGKKKNWTEEGRAAQTVALQNRVHTEESRRKRREKMKGIKWSPETNAKRVEANKIAFQKKLDASGFTTDLLKEMISEGSTIKDVADRFGISSPTVTRIIKDLGFDSPRSFRKSLVVSYENRMEPFSKRTPHRVRMRPVISPSFGS